MNKDDFDPLKMEDIFRKVSQVFIDEQMSSRDTLIIVSAMSEALYQVMINSPDLFANGPLDIVLGLREEGN